VHKQIPVAVLQAFDLRGQSYAPGQSAQIPTVDALILHRKKIVRITKRLEPAAPAPQVLEDEQPKRKRTYKRRDMQAEETTALQAHDERPTELTELIPVHETIAPSDE
jgi:hypothetical protein